MCSLFLLEMQSSIWETILAFLLAFIGGGIVNYMFEVYRESKRAKSLRHLIEAEIKMNLEILDSDYLRQNPWVSHKTWSAFYDANSIALISFSNKNTAETIMKFYANLELLRVRDEEYKNEIDRLNRAQLFDAAQHFRDTIGRGKHDVHILLIKLGREIIKVSQ